MAHNRGPAIGIGLVLALGVRLGISAAGEEDVSLVLSRSIEPYLTAAEGIREAFHEAGLASVDVRDMQGDAGEGARIAGELKQRRPRLIMTVGTEATQTISQQLSGIPIVFCMVVHPEALPSTDQPVTGISMEVSPHEALRVLRQVLPQARRVGLLANSAIQRPEAIGRRVAAAREQGLEVSVERIDAVTEVPQRLRALLPTIDAFWLIPDETVLAPEMVRYLMLETLRQQIPVLAPSWRFVEDGALVAVACDYKDVGRQAAELAVPVLRGAPGGRDPIVEARKSLLYVNLKVAKTLRIEIPASLISQAEQVIQ